MLCSMESHHREGRTDLMSLLNARQSEVLQLSVQIVVNLENKRLCAQLHSGLLQPGQKERKGWDCLRGS